MSVRAVRVVLFVLRATAKAPRLCTAFSIFQIGIVDLQYLPREASVRLHNEQSGVAGSDISLNGGYCHA